MSRIVDLTLPITSGMAGIPKIAFYDQYPTRVQAVTVVNEDQRAALTSEGVDCLTDAPAINSMNTVFTLNSHIGTHIDAPRHFYADGASISDISLDRIVMREAIVIDVSHKAAGQGVTASDLDRTGVKPGP
jgi:arylformamidase